MIAPARRRRRTEVFVIGCIRDSGPVQTLCRRSFELKQQQVFGSPVRFVQQSEGGPDLVGILSARKGKWIGVRILIVPGHPRSVTRHRQSTLRVIPIQDMPRRAEQLINELFHHGTTVGELLSIMLQQVILPDTPIDRPPQPLRKRYQVDVPTSPRNRPTCGDIFVSDRVPRQRGLAKKDCQQLPHFGSCGQERFQGEIAGNPPTKAIRCSPSGKAVGNRVSIGRVETIQGFVEGGHIAPSPLESEPAACV